MVAASGGLPSAASAGWSWHFLLLSATQRVGVEPKARPSVCVVGLDCQTLRRGVARHRALCVAVLGASCQCQDKIGQAHAVTENNAYS